MFTPKNRKGEGFPTESDMAPKEGEEKHARRGGQALATVPAARG